MGVLNSLTAKKISSVSFLSYKLTVSSRIFQFSPGFSVFHIGFFLRCFSFISALLFFFFFFFFFLNQSHVSNFRQVFSLFFASVSFCVVFHPVIMLSTGTFSLNPPRNRQTDNLHKFLCPQFSLLKYHKKTIKLAIHAAYFAFTIVITTAWILVSTPCLPSLVTENGIIHCIDCRNTKILHALLAGLIVRNKFPIIRLNLCFILLLLVSSYL